MLNILNICKNKGLFKCYPQDHFILFHFKGEKPRIQSSKYMDCYINYDTFIFNFKKNIFYIKENIDKDVFVKIVKEYLSCKNNYSDEVFFRKYSNLIILLGLFSIMNFNNRVWKINVSEHYLNCSFTGINGITIQIDFMEWNSRKIDVEEEYISAYYGLQKDRKNYLVNMLNEMNIKYYGLDEKTMIEYLTSLSVKDDLRYIQVIQAEDLEAFCEVQGLLHNAATGLYVSDELLNNSTKRRLELLLGTLLFQSNSEYLLLGDYRYLLPSKDNVFLVNTLQTTVSLSDVKKSLYPFHVKYSKDRICHRINVSENKSIVENILKFFLADREKFKEQLVKGIIRKNLEEIPDLYKCFEIDKEEAIIEIYKNFIDFENNILPIYPEGHILKTQGILLDAVGFSLVYCTNISMSFPSFSPDGNSFDTFFINT